MASRPLVAAYYFPNYHADRRNEKIHGPGWTEWELVKRAEPRFPGHRQPLVPAWGYEDEADPLVMKRKIDAAAMCGIDCFLFDWYYYDDGPFLERCLEQGFLKAENVNQIRFACMWANHDWENIHPARRVDNRQIVYPGKITPETFERMTDLLIDRYFSHPSHLRVNGSPFFSIYHPGLLLESFGGSIEAVREAFSGFREKARLAGFSGIHLNAIGWNAAILAGDANNVPVFESASKMGFDSIGNYVWIHFLPMSGSAPAVDYNTAGDAYFSEFDRLQRHCTIPVFPNVTMGWDSTPRTLASDVWDSSLGYPFTQVLTNNSPKSFQEALQEARRRAECMDDFAMITINAWNEWTEGSYLEPDTHYGSAYLEAIRAVFPPLFAG